MGQGSGEFLGKRFRSEAGAIRIYGGNLSQGISASGVSGDGDIRNGDFHQRFSHFSGADSLAELGLVSTSDRAATRQCQGAPNALSDLRLDLIRIVKDIVDVRLTRFPR